VIGIKVLLNQMEPNYHAVIGFSYFNFFVDRVTKSVKFMSILNRSVKMFSVRKVLYLRWLILNIDF